MPGMIHPAVKVLADIAQIDIPAGVVVLPLLQLTTKAPQAGPPKSAAVGPKVEPKEVQTPAAGVRNGKDGGLIVCAEGQVILQPTLCIDTKGLQVALIRVNHHEIVHVPYVPALAPSALCPLIEGVHIDVREQLTGEIADRQAFTRRSRLAVAANDILNDGHQAPVSNTLAKQAEQYLVIDTCKVFADVGLEHIYLPVPPEALAKHFLRFLCAGMGATANPAGVALAYKSGLPDGLYNSDNCILNNPISKKLQGRYPPALRLGHIKAAIGATLVLTPYQLVLKLYQIALQITLKMPARPAFSLSLPGFEVCAVQRFKCNDLIK